MRARLLTILCITCAGFMGCDKDSPDPNTPEATAKASTTGKAGDPPPQPTSTGKAQAPPATAKPQTTAKAKVGSQLQIRLWDRGPVLLSKGATISVPQNGTLILMPYPALKMDGALSVQGPFEKEERGRALALVFKGGQVSLGSHDVLISAFGEEFPLVLLVTEALHRPN